jgi:hypothetical protein
MTVRDATTTQSNRDSSSPAVRSVWDTVKCELTTLACSAFTGGVATYGAIMDGLHGHSSLAALKVAAVGAVVTIASRPLAHIIRTLQNIPAPKS